MCETTEPVVALVKSIKGPNYSDMKLWRIAAVCAALVASVAWLGARHQATPDTHLRLAKTDSQVARGARAFVSHDFGGLSMDALESHALPWKVVAAALVLEDQAASPESVTHRALEQRLSSFGFLTAPAIANLPDGVSQGRAAISFGMTYGYLSPVGGTSLFTSNLGCAACHAGVTYDAQGRPDPTRVWLGMPNTSLNLESYVTEVFHSLKQGLEAPDDLLTAVRTLYPDTGWRERQTLRFVVVPLVRARLAALDGESPLPFPNGVPGSTNGVAALKHALGFPLLDGGAGDAGIVSIPDLGHRHWKTSLLTDGAYALPHVAANSVTAEDVTQGRLAQLAAITSFFTVPSMGVNPEDALSHVEAAEDIFAFLNEAYTPQPFPGRIDAALAAEGARVYETECSACHGTYAPSENGPMLTIFPNWLGDVGTDTLRLEVFDQALVDSFTKGPYNKTIAARRTDGYVAPPLTGLWASAPYLHNGSVPTIAQLLSPADRADQFLVGGHNLDFENMGLLLSDPSPEAPHPPFATPILTDTNNPGFGNAGHNFGADLSDEDKRALIEFLKQL